MIGLFNLLLIFVGGGDTIHTVLDILAEVQSILSHKDLFVFPLCLFSFEMLDDGRSIASL